MAHWVKMKNGLIGMVVSELKLHAGKVYGLDLTGEGDIYYVPVKETTPYVLPCALECHATKGNYKTNA